MCCHPSISLLKFLSPRLHRMKCVILLQELERQIENRQEDVAKVHKFEETMRTAAAEVVRLNPLLTISVFDHFPPAKFDLSLSVEFKRVSVSRSSGSFEYAFGAQSSGGRACGQLGA